MSSLHLAARRMLLASLCSMFLLAAPVQAQPYTVTDLGTLGLSTVWAFDINNNKQIVGTSTLYNPMTGTYSPRGYRWSGGVMQDLGVLPGGNSSRARGTNKYGWAAGWATDANGTRLPTFQTTGGWITIPQPGSMGEASSVNDFARTAGHFLNNQGEYRPFTYHPFIGFTDLGALPGVEAGLAFTVNNLNMVGGWSRLGPSPCGIFSASKPTVWQLGDDGNWHASSLPFNDCAGLVFGSNESGMLVGETSTGFTHRPAQWTFYSGAWHVGYLDMGGQSSGSARDVNKYRITVGDLGQRAYIWQHGLAVDLNTQIPANSGWVLKRATAINDCGVITGDGIYQGATRAFILEPAWPSKVCP